MKHEEDHSVHESEPEANMRQNGCQVERSAFTGERDMHLDVLLSRWAGIQRMLLQFIISQEKNRND